VAKTLYFSSQNTVNCYKSFCSVSKFLITNTTFFSSWNICSIIFLISITYLVLVHNYNAIKCICFISPRQRAGMSSRSITKQCRMDCSRIWPTSICFPINLCNIPISAWGYPIWSYKSNHHSPSSWIMPCLKPLQIKVGTQTIHLSEAALGRSLKSIRFLFMNTVQFIFIQNAIRKFREKKKKNSALEHRIKRPVKIVVIKME